MSKILTREIIEIPKTSEGTKKWMKQLKGIDGVVETGVDINLPENVLSTGSPSLNYVFGKPGGIPKGLSCILFSKPKQGKSLISYLFAGNLHKTDPEAIVVRFDTEYRSGGQMQGGWGIDYDRFLPIDSNTGAGVFDVINGEIKDMLEQGAPIKMIIIDSVSGISGIKESNAESTSDHIIGDNAMAIQRGLKAILPVIRKHKVTLILTAHVRDNLNAGMYGNPLKMQGGWYLKHFAEFYLEVSRDNSKEGKADLLGNALVNDASKDFKDNKDITGHKIYVKMTENSLGVAGRSGEFTIDYNKGLINTHEEVFQLGINLGIVQRPNNRTYVFEDKQYTSKELFLTAIRDDKKLSDSIIKKVRERDLN